MTRGTGAAALAISIVIAGLCAGLIAWRLKVVSSGPRLPQAGITRQKPQSSAKPETKVSTIIDLPGDPVLVRRGQVTTPLKDVLIAVPAKLGQESKIVTKAYFVNSTLVSTTGGYMGKYQESGQEADDLALQLAVNSETPGELNSRRRLTLVLTTTGGRTRRRTPEVKF